MTLMKTFGELYRRTNPEELERKRLFFETSNEQVYRLVRKLKRERAEISWITQRGRYEIVDAKTLRNDRYLGGVNDLIDRLCELLHQTPTEPTGYAFSFKMPHKLNGQNRSNDY